MSAKLFYLPGAQEEQLAVKIVELWTSIRNDITRFLKYKEKCSLKDTQDNKKIDILMNKCRKRLLIRLEKVVTIQSEYKKTNEEFEDILKRALQKYGKNSLDFHSKFETLRTIYHNDSSITKVHFLQSFMHILAGIPEIHVNIPFHK